MPKLKRGNSWQKKKMGRKNKKGVMDKFNIIPSSSENPSITLTHVFNRIIKSNGQIELSLQDLNSIIETDLNLDLAYLDDAQKKTLPYMLARYIKNWPGWLKKYEYDNGTIALESWMARFMNYINYKMQALVTRILPQLNQTVSDQSESDNQKTLDSGTQTESKLKFSNFSIDLSGPASLLSNLVFSGEKNDIKIEEHSERSWVPLEYDELMNYPFVEVEFNSPELSFKRSFHPKLNQYLSISTDKVTEDSNFILGKSGTHSNFSEKPIKISVLESHIEAFKLKACTELLENQQKELIALLDQFRQDMVDISENIEIFENMQIAFNIGRNTYRRTKKISSRDSLPDVVLNEIYLPRVKISFRHFTEMKKNDGHVTAESDEFDAKAMFSFKHEIAYKCTFCKMAFEGPEASSSIMKHLENIHKRAQTLACLHCKNCYEIAVLSKERWRCNCQV